MVLGHVRGEDEVEVWLEVEEGDGEGGYAQSEHEALGDGCILEA